MAGETDSNVIYDLEIGLVKNLPAFQLNIAVEVTEDLSDVLSCFEALLAGKFEELLKSDLGKALLSVPPDDHEESFDSRLEKRILAYLSPDNQDASIARSACVLGLAVACLQLFVQSNWTGPTCNTKPEIYLAENWHSTEKTTAWNAYVLESLEDSGEVIYQLCSHPLYLVIARTILLNCGSYLTHLQTAEWWLLRCLWVHQQLLAERSPKIKTAVMKLLESISKREPLMTDDKNTELHVQFYVEAANLCYFFYEPSLAKGYLYTAQKICGLVISHTGALGKRTRFQQNDLAQLVLQVTRDGTSREEPESYSNELLPKDLALQDDVVLNEIEFKDSSQQFVVPVSGVEQALILGLCNQHRKLLEGQGKIVEEESLAFVTCVLGQPRCWAVQSTALLQRCRWESENTRRIERSLSQLEELVSQFSRPHPQAHHRLLCVYSVHWPPHWVIERDLAEYMYKMGATNAALQIYERLQLWEDVIGCYQKLGRLEKAEKLIREQLAVSETPTLWCFLGDVKRDPQYYIKAWEMSNCRHSRSMRNLAFLYMNQQKYDDAVVCFEKSVSVNSLQVGVWFAYGCSALAIPNYDLAARCFRRCVTLDYDNFQAWNNLSTAYIRSNQKQKAFLTLKEAIKCSFDNWRVWENYLAVATDCGEFSEIIQAYHRLLDLKQKHTDPEVLGILVKAINKDILDPNGLGASHLRSKALELFGRITSVVTTDSDIWQLYGELQLACPDISVDLQDKALQHLQKSHRCCIQQAGWEKMADKCKVIAQKSLDLSKLYVQFSSRLEAPHAIRILTSAKLMLKGVHTKLKQTHANPTTGEISDMELGTLYQAISEELEQIVNKLSCLQATAAR